MEISFETFFLVIYFTVFLTAHGCGVTPAGRERTVNFTLTDFKLPAVMVYSEDPLAKSQAPTISTTKSEAETFVRTLIRQSVEDVLYEQGRSAFLSDNVINLILQQLDVQMSYDPLHCEIIINAAGVGAMMNKLNCVIVGGTVTSTCMNAQANMCMGAPLATNSKLIPPQHLSISGSLKTNNAVMANWSNQMWQGVLNRVLRRVTSSSIGSFFYGASVTL